MPLRRLIPLFLVTIALTPLSVRLHAQLYGCVHAGPLVSRGLDASLMYYPRNTDWFSISAGGGAVVPARMFIAWLSEDCLRKFSNGGWNVFVSVRNGLTDDHHSSHIFWGVKLAFAGMTEKAITESCHPLGADEPLKVQNRVLSGGVMAGYCLNFGRILRNPSFSIDLGLQAGIPLWKQQAFIGRLDYVPGIGYGRVGSAQGFNLELVAVARYELWHGRYGYSRPYCRKVGKS